MGNGISDSRMHHGRRTLIKRSPTVHSSSHVYSSTSANSKAREQKLQLDRYWIESSMDIPRCRSLSILGKSYSSDCLMSFDAQLSVLAATQAFKRQRQTILDASETAFKLTSYLLSKDVVPEATKTRVIFSGLSRAEMTVAFMDAIEARIMVDPSVFDSIVELLKAHPSMGKFAEELLQSQKEFSDIYAIHLKAITEPATVRYADFLKAYYKSLLQLPKFKWPLPPSRKPFNIHLLPLSSDEGSGKSQSIGIHYLLSVPEGKPKLGCLLLEGEWGVGKTSLAIELCKRWEEIASLKSYSLLVLLRAEERSVQEAKSLTDIFIHHNSNLQHDVAKEVSANEGEGLLLIIDSAERLLTLSNENSIVLNILKGLVLPRCTVMLLCWRGVRSEITALLQGERVVERRVELVGFTEEEIEQHAEASIGYDSNLLNGFHSYLSANPAVRSTMNIPFHTAIVVEAFKQARLTMTSPPATLTDMYTVLSKHILLQHILLQGAAEDGFTFTKFEDLPSKVYSQLCNISKLAFSQLSSGEVLRCRLPKGCYHLGFLVGLPELYTSRRRSSMFHSYLHFHLQEFLAAFHISRLQPNDQLDVFHKFMTSPTFSGVWRFLSGMTELRAPPCMEVLVEVVEEGSLSPTVLQCLYEAHRHVSCEQLLQTSSLTFPQAHYGEEITPLDCYRLGACLAYSSCEACLQLRVDSSMLHHLQLGLKSSGKTTSSIHTLYLRPPVSRHTLDILGTLPQQILKGLDLSHCDLNRDTVDLLAAIAPQLINLRHIDIRGNPNIGGGGMVKLLQSLKSLKALERLNIINVGLGCPDVEALSSLLSKSRSLHQLSVGEEGLPDDCLSSLLHATLSSPCLVSLHLWLIDLKHHMEQTKELIASKQCKLRELEFHGCKIGEDCCKVFSQGMANNRSITKLVLSLFDVPLSRQLSRGGAQAMADMLLSNNTLKNLEILFDRSLTRLGADSLIAALSLNRTLTSLKLPQQHFSQAEIVAMDTRVNWSSP